MKIRIILLLAGASLLVWGCEEGLYDHWRPAPGDDEYGHVISSSDHGGYLAAGQKYYVDSYSDVPDLYLVRLDEGGHVEWTTTYSTGMYSEPLAIQETNDRGFVILAQESGHYGTQRVFIFKVDVYGHVMWTEDIQTGNMLAVTDARAAADGEFILLGSGGGQITLMEVNAGGGVNFAAHYTSSYAPVEVVEVTGGFAILSNVDRNADSSTVELMRTDWWGDPQWTSLIWSEGAWTAFHLAEDPDGGFLISGETYRGMPSSIPLLIRTDYHGNWMWRANYSEAAGAVINAQVSGYSGTLLAGKMSYGGDDRDGFALQATSDGDWLWWHAYGGSDIDWLMDAIPGNNGGYVLAGTSASYNQAGDTDMFILKMDLNGSRIWETTAGD